MDLKKRNWPKATAAIIGIASVCTAAVLLNESLVLLALILVIFIIIELD